MTSGLINFRPLAGFRRPETQQLCVYRSGTLGATSSDDITDLRDRFGIAAYVDLHHRKDQFEQEPVSGHLISAGIAVICVPITAIVSSPKTADPTAGEYAAYYAAILDQCAASLARAFCEVARFGAGGVLFACLQGKDRAGILAAALHEAIGTSREDILRDYAQSGPALDRIAGIFGCSAEKRGLALEQYRRRYQLGAGPMAALFELLGGSSQKPIFSRLAVAADSTCDMDAAVKSLLALTRQARHDQH